MSKTPDAFAHLPHLRGKVIAPCQSELRATADVLCDWDRRARSQGRQDNWRLSDQVLQESMQASLAGIDSGQDLWVFSYGSLMWNPGFHFAEVRLAKLDDHQRCFSLKVDIGRGTVNCPALMLSLEQQPGCCTGLAFRIAADQLQEELAILWRREMIQGSYAPTMLPITTPQGNRTALAFVSNPCCINYVGPQSLDETAQTIARASGFIGSNRQYLEQLAAQLAHLDIDDDYIRQLLARVDHIAAVDMPPP
jgi:glutathione-specific gamma-glutamylcyclotransferase